MALPQVVPDTDCATFVGAAVVTPLITMLHSLAEQHVCDYLGWQQIVEGTWTEYYPQVQANSPVADPHYIVESSHQRAIPGYYLSPNTLQLQQLPVRSITSLYEDATGYFGQVAGSFAAGTLLTQGADYFLKVDMTASGGSDNLTIPGGAISFSGHLVRRAFYFPAIMGSVKITYVSGFTAAELTGRFSCFRTAVLETFADLYMRSMSMGLGQRPELASESLGGGVSSTYTDPRLSGLAIPDSAAQRLQWAVFYGDRGL